MNRDREHWLNGWNRYDNFGSNTILYGARVCCVGCGKSFGLTCIAITEDWTPPPEPNWPFEVETCPVHNRPKHESEIKSEPVDKLTQRVLAIRADAIRLHREKCDELVKRMEAVAQLASARMALASVADILGKIEPDEGIHDLLRDLRIVKRIASAALKPDGDGK